MFLDRNKITINQKSLKKFKDVLKKEFDLELSDEMAILLKEKLINYYQLLYDIYKRNPEDIEALINKKSEKVDKSKTKL